MDRPSALLEHALENLPPAPLVVALSGGLDSRVLLHALARRRPEQGLRALHVDHGLNPASAEWAGFCRALCAADGVALDVLCVQVDCNAGLGLEGAARAARYRALEAALRPGEVLLLAQHRDDQAETLLLRLMRGAGSHGLAAMRSRRRLGRNSLWRPLLHLGRDQLAAYAHHHGLRWLDDPLNDSLDLDRNHLRHVVLPALRNRWPEAAARLADSAARLAGEADRLERQTRRNLALCLGLDPSTLLVPALRDLASSERLAVLQRWLLQGGASPAGVDTLQRLERLLEVAPRDRGYPRVQWAAFQVERYRDLLHIGRAGDPASWPALSWDGLHRLALPGGGWLDLRGPRPAAQTWRVSIRCGGERMHLPGRRHRSDLKQVLQALGLPPWERRQLPLVWQDDGELLAAGDLVLSANFERWQVEQGCRLHWCPAETGP